MRRGSAVVAMLGSLALMVPPAHAQGRSIRIGIGYAFASYLESGGGSAPSGAFASVASTGNVGFEGDVAYHRRRHHVQHCLRRIGRGWSGYPGRVEPAGPARSRLSDLFR